MTNSTKPKKPRPENLKKSDYRCDFCKKNFVSDGNLLKHTCERKRRHLQKDEKPELIGYFAYQAFWKKSYPNKTIPNQSDFARSSVYLAMVRFGRCMVNLDPINLPNFIDFLLRLQIKIDDWTRPDLYEKYIRELNKNETPLDALQRNFDFMQDWAIKNNIEDWRNFFRKIDAPLAALLIANGRISPWLLFVASSAHELTERFSPDQVALIKPYIDPVFWQLKIEHHHEDVEMIRDFLKQHGI